MVIPPEMLGTHVGPTLGHQMHRTHDIHFRVINALFGHAGIEWNITEASEREIEVLRKYITFYKQHRGLLHSGRVVRSDLITEKAYLYGTVAHDKSEAIYSYMQLTSNDNFGPLRATFEGLDANRKYRISVVEELSSDYYIQKKAPGWWPSIESTGDQLANIGLTLPGLVPDTGILFHVIAI